MTVLAELLLVGLVLVALYAVGTELVACAREAGQRRQLRRVQDDTREANCAIQAITQAAQLEMLRLLMMARHRGNQG